MGLFRHKLLVGLLAVTLLAGSVSAQDATVPPEGGVIEAMRNAVNLHPAIKSRKDQLYALGFDLEAEKARRYPSLSVQAQALSNDASQVFARIQQPLWVGGRIDGSIDQAGMRLLSGQASFLTLKRQLMEETGAAYAVLVGARQRLAAAELNVREHEKLLGLISRRQVGSIASEADVRLARSRLTLAVAQREQLKGELSRALTNLHALTQQPLEGVVPIPDTVMALPEHSGLVAAIVEISPTVKQRLVDIEVARAEVELRRADLMPSLYARVDQDIYATDRYGTLPAETRAGVVLEGSLEGAGFSGWKRVRSADSRVEAARKDVEVARNDARRQAQALLAEMEALQSVLVSNDQLVTATEETLASFMRQYDAGRKTWVDVLNAQRELSDARLSLEQTRSSLQQNSLRLAVQLGQLDSAMETQP